MFNTVRRYAQKGDEKPCEFRVGDLFTWSNGETAVVTEAGNTMRFMWTPGKDGDTTNQRKLGNPTHGTCRINAFNQLCIGRGSYFYGRKNQILC